MRKPVFIANALALACMLGASPLALAANDTLSAAAGNYRIDKTSAIHFAVDQVGGGGIRGVFPEYSGNFSIDGGDVGRSSVTITLFPKSVRANEGRMDDFLRSDAVFDVAEYPKITFRSTSVKQTGPSTADIEGVLTARGKSRPAEFHAALSRQGGSRISFHVTGQIYRSPYGMGVGTPIYSNLVKFDMTLNGTRN